MLNFTLTYDGPIPSGGKGSHVAEKQAIRRVFHPQLRNWWETGPMAATLKEIDKTIYQVIVMTPLNAETGFTFMPLACSPKTQPN